MADPIGKIGQMVAEKVVTESSKSNPTSGGSSDFAKLLSERLEGLDKGNLRDQIYQVFGMSPGEPQVKAASAEGLEVDPSQITAKQEIRTEGKVVDLMSDVNSGALQLDNIIEMVSSGKSMTPQSLLAVQANLASIVFQLETFKSVAEQSNTGVKTVMNTSFA